jgi:hypothetical protein
VNLREAAEEVGLDPSLPQVAGQLPHHVTGTGYRVTPVVAFLAPPLKLTPQPGEVAAIFEMPLATLFDPGAPERQRAEWRGRMRDETDATAGALRDRLVELEAKSGVRLASVSDRVRRPFTAALEQDELEALVAPAVAEVHTGTPPGAAARLEAKALTFLGVASGSGVEVPEWLERLRSGVERSLERAEAGGLEESKTILSALAEAVPLARMPWVDLRAELP